MIHAGLRKTLKARAHALKPVVITGQRGLTSNVMNEISVALDHHELIKIRVNAGDREERQTMIDQICTESSAELIQSLGHVITVYRKSQKPG